MVYSVILFGNDKKFKNNEWFRNDERLRFNYYLYIYIHTHTEGREREKEKTNFLLRLVV